MHAQRSALGTWPWPWAPVRQRRRCGGCARQRPQRQPACGAGPPAAIMLQEEQLGVAQGAGHGLPRRGGAGESASRVCMHGLVHVMMHCGSQATGRYQAGRQAGRQGRRGGATSRGACAAGPTTQHSARRKGTAVCMPLRWARTGAGVACVSSSICIWISTKRALLTPCMPACLPSLTSPPPPRPTYSPAGHRVIPWRAAGCGWRGIHCRGWWWWWRRHGGRWQLQRPPAAPPVPSVQHVCRRMGGAHGSAAPGADRAGAGARRKQQRLCHPHQPQRGRVVGAGGEAQR